MRSSDRRHSRWGNAHRVDTLFVTCHRGVPVDLNVGVQHKIVQSDVPGRSVNIFAWKTLEDQGGPRSEQSSLPSDVPSRERSRTQKEGPLFLFGGAGGQDELGLLRFRRHPKQVLEVHLVPIGDWHIWETDFDALVSRACSYIEVLNGNGAPICLAGYSQGGQLAYATALAFERSGTSVSKVALLDTYEGFGAQETGTRRHNDAFSNLPFKRGIVAPALAWFVAKARKQDLCELPGGDPRFRLLLGIRRLPLGLVLIRTFSRVAPLFVSSRVAAALNRHIRRGRFHEIWFDWVKRLDRRQPLKAQVILFRSRDPGVPDRGWASHNLKLRVVPVAGTHQTMLMPEHIDTLVAGFATVMAEIHTD